MNLKFKCFGFEIQIEFALKMIRASNAVFEEIKARRPAC